MDELVGHGTGFCDFPSFGKPGGWDFRVSEVPVKGCGSKVSEKTNEIFRGRIP